MGVKERRKEKEKAEAASKTAEEEVEPVKEIRPQSIEETHRPVVEIVEEASEIVPEATNEGVVEAVADDVTTSPVETILLPSWGNQNETEWMYSIPPREEDKKMWAEEWADFVLGWAEASGIHVLSVTTFIKEPPFSDISGKVDSFQLIGEVLVEKKIAEWLDEARRQLRVYWRFLEEWADIMYQWAMKSGKLRLDVKSIVIQEEEQGFANLPEKDIHIIMRIMVEKGMATWVDKTKGAIKVKV
ncbi:MAG: hypothetical protein ACE5H4_05310 [Candidatus Thorarchaeota archaeon]